MKKLFIALLAILMLSACGKQEVPEQLWRNRRLSTPLWKKNP